MGFWASCLAARRLPVAISRMGGDSQGEDRGFEGNMVAGIPSRVRHGVRHGAGVSMLSSKYAGLLFYK
jgi:hypothetical protein